MSVVKMPAINCKYGAPMGRGTDSNKPAGRTVRLYRVPLDSGGYDNGGAYWGHGGRLYCAECTESDYREFTRAESRRDAAAQLGIEALLIKRNKPQALQLTVCAECYDVTAGNVDCIDADRQGEIEAALTAAGGYPIPGERYSISIIGGVK